MNTKNWYTSKEIIEISGYSKRTIERRKKELLSANPESNWFRIKSKPYRYNSMFLADLMGHKLYNLFKKSGDKDDEIRKLSNTIDCLFRTGSLEQHFAFLEWDYFVTIAYRDSFTTEACYSIMSRFYEQLLRDFPNSHLRIFFTTESFKDRTGLHNHLILRNADVTSKGLRKLITRLIPAGMVDIQPYNKKYAGIFYIGKDGLEGENWDIFGNCLVEDGIEALMNNPRHRVA